MRVQDPEGEYILDAQEPDGHWSKPGAGYLKYTGTVWSVVFLAMFGAEGRDPAVRRAACGVEDFFVDVPWQGEVVRARDLYAAIDLVADKLDRQVVKHKEKVSHHNHDKRSHAD